MSVRGGIARLLHGWRAAALVLALLAPPAAAQTQADPETASGETPTPLALGERFMVVAAHPFAATAGSQILQDGDLTVATVVAPRTEEAPAPVAEEAESEEPELIRKPKADEEEEETEGEA